MGTAGLRSLAMLKRAGPAVWSHKPGAAWRLCRLGGWCPRPSCHML